MKSAPVRSVPPSDVDDMGLLAANCTDSTSSSLGFRAERGQYGIIRKKRIRETTQTVAEMLSFGAVYRCS